MNRILLALLCLATSAQAAPDSELVRKVIESQFSCDTFLRFDDQNVYFGFRGYFRVVPLSGAPTFDLPAREAAIDIITMGDSAFVLSPTSIEEWNLTTKSRVGEYSTTLAGGFLGNKQIPESFARYGDKLVIAHGRLGVTLFDLKEKRVTRELKLIQTQAPLESMAVGVGIQGKFAYVALANFTIDDRAFRGIVKIDLESESVVAELPGLDPGVTSLNVDENELIASYAGNPLWRYNLSSIGGKSLPNPISRVVNFKEKGHPTGQASMDAKYYYTCFAQPPKSGRGVWRNRPSVWERSQIWPK